MKQRINKIIILQIFISFIFFACAGQASKKEGGNYKVVFVESINIKSKYITDLNTDEKEQISDEDSKYIKKITAIISKKDDSVTTYNFKSDLNSTPVKNLFTSKRKNETTRIFLNFNENEKVRVQFKSNNIIIIENDLYTVNKAYYEFLKKEILEKGSVLALISLIKEGYGDYSILFSPLIDYTWSTETNNNFKIQNVKVKSINYSGEIITPWEIVYSNNSVKSERFNKKLIKSNGVYNSYRIETTDERSVHTQVVYQNKMTKLDSIVGNWYLYSTNVEYKYTQYQTKLKIVEVDKLPKDLESMLKLFKD